MARKVPLSSLYRPVSPFVVFAVLLLGAVVAWAAFLRPTAQPLGINEVGVTGQVFTATTCNKNNLDSLRFANPCGIHGFRDLYYRCAGDPIERSSTGTKACNTPSTLQQQAERLCPAVCPKPSFSPLSVASPRTRCLPRPVCLDNNPPCKLTLPADTVLCSPTPKPMVSAIPSTSCVPRPACLDNSPPCRLMESDRTNYCVPSPLPVQY